MKTKKNREYGMKILIIALICGAAIAAWCCSKSKPSMKKSNENSRRELNEQAFASMRAKTKWNLEGDMLWGFFFTNPTKPSLEIVAKQLEKQGYRIIEIYLDDKQENWWLHVEKVETHTVDSLTRREAELADIAVKANLCSYDGWDVGLVLNK